MSSDDPWPSAHRLLGRWLLVAALLAHLPALTVGFLADDYVHLWRLERANGAPVLDLYDFRAALRSAREAGGLGATTWWMSPEWQVSFVRPLTSLWTWLDHRLYGASSIGPHTEQLAALGLCCVLLVRVLRGLGLGALAAPSMLVFALEDSSAVPVGWLANRNSLLALLLGLGALACLGRFDRTPTRGRTALALALAAAAPWAKESGIVFLALVAAWWWRAPRDAPRGRWTVPVVAGALALAFVGAWIALGAGSSSRFYPLPWEQPVEVLGRLAMLVACTPVALLTPVPTDLAFHRPELASAIVALGAVGWLMLWPLVRAARRERDPASGFLALWFGLALLPQASAPLADRLYFEASAPAAGWFALAIVGTAGTARGAGLVRVLLVLTTVVAGLSLVARLLVLAVVASESRAFVGEVLEAADREQRGAVLMLQAPNPLALLSPGATAVAAFDREDVALVPLQLAGRGLELGRTQDGALRITSRGSPLSAAPMEQVFRSAGDGLEPGRAFATGELRVVVQEVERTRTGDGARTVVVRGLDERRWCLVVPGPEGPQVVPVPVRGETVELPAVQGLLQLWE